jgi:hypothetical protein
MFKIRMLIITDSMSLRKKGAVCRTVQSIIIRIEWLATLHGLFLWHDRKNLLNVLFRVK